MGEYLETTPFCVTCGCSIDPGEPACSGCGTPSNQPEAAESSREEYVLANDVPSGYSDATVIVEVDDDLTVAFSREFETELTVLDEPDEPKPALVASLSDSQGGIFRVALSTQDDLFILGRDSARTDLALRDPRVSRIHAAIGVHDERPFVRDLSSSNGTWVNAERVSGDTLLQAGDTIRIGRTELAFSV